MLEFSSSQYPLWETFAAAQPASWSSCHRGTLWGCRWARDFPSLMTLLPHARLPQGQKHPLIICSLCCHPCWCSSAGGGELCREVAGVSAHVDPGSCPNLTGPLKAACGPVALTIPEQGGQRAAWRQQVLWTGPRHHRQGDQPGVLRLRTKA